MFTDNLTYFSQLIEESVGDISINSIKQYSDINEGKESGISCFVVNRLAYTIFHEIKCIKSIEKITNGFNDILNWKKACACQYFDQETNQSQIVEIQLLVKFC